MAKQVDTFSGSKSKVTIAKSGTYTLTAITDLTVASTFPSTTTKTVFAVTEDITATATTPSAKKGDVFKYNGTAWEKLSDILVLYAKESAITASGNIPAIEQGQFAFFYNGAFINPKDTTKFKEPPIYLRDNPDGTKTGAYAYMLTLTVNSVTDTNLNNEAETDEYSVLGEMGSRVSKGAVKSSGSISGKLDFGYNPAQKIMYKSIFEDENVFLSFYEFFYQADGKIDLEKCTVTEGEAIVTSFDISMSPSQAADFSCNYMFDGHPTFRDGSEII